MDRIQILLDSWITNTDQLTKSLAEFNFETFNRKPENGGWTAGQVGEHILIFDKRLNLLLEDCITPAGRDPHQQIKAITDRLTDRVNKIEAPEFLKPSDGSKDPNAIIEKIRAERAIVAKIIQQKDLSLLNAKTPHRFFDTLTALEWIILVMEHTKRHLPQLIALGK
jgi:hypothetical protein